MTNEYDSQPNQWINQEELTSHLNDFLKELHNKKILVTMKQCFVGLLNQKSTV